MFDRKNVFNNHVWSKQISKTISAEKKFCVLYKNNTHSVWLVCEWLEFKKEEEKEKKNYFACLKHFYLLKRNWAGLANFRK
jgi:hypothetical protein